MKYSLVIEEIWSANPFLPKSSSIVYKEREGTYLTVGKSNRFGKFTWRLRLRIVRTEYLPRPKKPLPSDSYPNIFNRHTYREIVGNNTKSPIE